MKKKEQVLTALTAFTASVTSAGTASDRPNILIIMTDDMRFDQMTHEGHPYIQTPHLDRLAAEGMRFTQAYAPTPLCGPCRMTVLSGRLASAHGRVDNFYYPEDYEFYLPLDFRTQGFRTALIGKYYEGNVFKRKIKPAAYDFWFEFGEPDLSNFTGRRGTPEYVKFRNEHLYYDQEYEVGDEIKVIKGHQTDILFAAAADYAVAQPEKPHMTLVMPFAPHAPFNPTLRRKGKYTGKGIPMTDNVQFGIGYMTPTRINQLNGVHERTCEMIEDIDEGVGNLLKALEESGQLDNTIIIFTSDNGVMFGEHGFGWKRHPWQESIKVPLIIRYPKVIKPGSVCHAPVTLADLFPTCAELAGVKLQEDPFRYGKSLVPLLTGHAKSVRDATVLMQYESGIQGQVNLRPENLNWVSLIRDDGWKLIRYRIGPPEDMRPDYGDTFLFNLKKDPLEMNNQAGNPEYRDLIEQLKQQLAEELKANKAEAEWL